MPITTDVASSNPDQGEVYNICDKFCQWLATVRWFSSGTPVSSTNKTDHHDITEILLKVALSTIKPKPEIRKVHCSDYRRLHFSSLPNYPYFSVAVKNHCLFGQSLRRIYIRFLVLVLHIAEITGAGNIHRKNGPRSMYRDSPHEITKNRDFGYFMQWFFI